MKSHIVSDGQSRLRANAEFQKRLRELREAIRTRHASDFAAAGLLRRLALHCRMSVEFHAEARKITPSPGSLYFNRFAA